MKTTYEMDFYGWTEEQTHLLKQKDYSKVDWQNLIDEIESLGRSEKRSLTSLLTIYFMHLLKKKYQPNHDCRSWDLSIKNSHLKFLERLSENPGLKSKLKEILVDAYVDAIQEATKETGLDEEVFPKECPWTIEEVLKQGS